MISKEPRAQIEEATKFQSLNLPEGSIHPAWAAALASTMVGPLDVMLKQAPAGPALESSTQPAAPAVVATVGVAIPISASALLDKAQLAAQLGQLGKTPHRSAVPEKLWNEISADIIDIFKFNQPESHSGADAISGGLLIVANTSDMLQALQDRDPTRTLLTGAQLGANAVDLVASTTDALAGLDPTGIHGVCLFIRAASGIAKICLELKKPDGSMA